MRINESFPPIVYAYLSANVFRGNSAAAKQSEGVEKEKINVCSR